MTDEGTGSIGIWNVHWGYSRVDSEEFNSIIVLLIKLHNDSNIWIASAKGELIIYHLADKIGRIRLSSSESIVTDIKWSATDKCIVCGTAEGLVFKHSMAAFITD